MRWSVPSHHRRCCRNQSVWNCCWCFLKPFFFVTKSRKLDFYLQETKPNKLLLVFIEWLYQNPSTDELEFDSFATNGNVLNDSKVESAEKTFWLFFFFEKLAGSNYSDLRSAFKTIFSKELMSKVSRLWLWKRTKMRKSKYLRS